MPECVDPLLQSIKHFVKPASGKCLLVNNFVRTEAFLEQIGDTAASLSLTLDYQPDVVEHATDKTKKYKVSLLTAPVADA